MSIDISHTYIERDAILGADIHWKDAVITYSQTTHRGTLLEFVNRPQWGTSCFMNSTIQSCMSDEYEYHTSLVNPCFEKNPDSNNIVAIFGGGEGATAREVLRHANVSHVDMYEWDRDVVNVFQRVFPHWARGAWQDKRLNVHIEDAFAYILKIHNGTYNGVIVDLFEPEDQSFAEWKAFLTQVYRILGDSGSISMYIGMYDRQAGGIIQRQMCGLATDLGFLGVRMLRRYIPSYLGEACFLVAEKAASDSE
jgi:spermidine synthase